MTLATRLAPGIVLLAAFIAGCSANQVETTDGAPLARQLTQSDHCGLTAPGLVYLDEPGDVERLAGLPAQTLSLQSLKDVDFQREHLVVVGLGQKPTGGYGVTLRSSAIVDDVLQLTMKVHEPAPETMVTQVVTTPCAVIAVTPETWESLRVSGEGMANHTRKR